MWLTNIIFICYINIIMNDKPIQQKLYVFDSNTYYSYIHYFLNSKESLTNDPNSKGGFNTSICDLFNYMFTKHENIFDNIKLIQHFNNITIPDRKNGKKYNETNRYINKKIKTIKDEFSKVEQKLREQTRDRTITLLDDFIEKLTPVSKKNLIKTLTLDETKITLEFKDDRCFLLVPISEDNHFICLLLHITKNNDKYNVMIYYINPIRADIYYESITWDNIGDHMLHNIILRFITRYIYYSFPRGFPFLSINITQTINTCYFYSIYKATILYLIINNLIEDGKEVNKNNIENYIGGYSLVQYIEYDKLNDKSLDVNKSILPEIILLYYLSFWTYALLLKEPYEFNGYLLIRYNAQVSLKYRQLYDYITKIRTHRDRNYLKIIKLTDPDVYTRLLLHKQDKQYKFNSLIYINDNFDYRTLMHDDIFSLIERKPGKHEEIKDKKDDDEKVDYKGMFLYINEKRYKSELYKAINIDKTRALNMCNDIYVPSILLNDRSRNTYNQEGLEDIPFFTEFSHLIAILSNNPINSTATLNAIENKTQDIINDLNELNEVTNNSNIYIGNQRCRIYPLEEMKKIIKSLYYNIDLCIRFEIYKFIIFLHYIGIEITDEIIGQISHYIKLYIHIFIHLWYYYYKKSITIINQIHNDLYEISGRYMGFNNDTSDIGLLTLPNNMHSITHHYITLYFLWENDNELYKLGVEYRIIPHTPPFCANIIHDYFIYLNPYNYILTHIKRNIQQAKLRYGTPYQNKYEIFIASNSGIIEEKLEELIKNNNLFIEKYNNDIDYFNALPKLLMRYKKRNGNTNTNLFLTQRAYPIYDRNYKNDDNMYMKLAYTINSTATVPLYILHDVKTLISKENFYAYDEFNKHYINISPIFNFTYYVNIIYETFTQIFNSIIYGTNINITNLPLYNLDVSKIVNFNYNLYSSRNSQCNKWIHYFIYPVMHINLNERAKKKLQTIFDNKDNINKQDLISRSKNKDDYIWHLNNIIFRNNFIKNNSFFLQIYLLLYSNDIKSLYNKYITTDLWNKFEKTLSLSNIEVQRNVLWCMYYLNVLPPRDKIPNVITESKNDTFIDYLYTEDNHSSDNTYIICKYIKQFKPDLISGNLTSQTTDRLKKLTSKYNIENYREIKIDPENLPANLQNIGFDDTYKLRNDIILNFPVFKYTGPKEDQKIRAVEYENDRYYLYIVLHNINNIYNETNVLLGFFINKTKLDPKVEKNGRKTNEWVTIGNMDAIFYNNIVFNINTPDMYNYLNNIQCGLSFSDTNSQYILLFLDKEQDIIYNDDCSINTRIDDPNKSKLDKSNVSSIVLFKLTKNLLTIDEQNIAYYEFITSQLLHLGANIHGILNIPYYLTDEHNTTNYTVVIPQPIEYSHFIPASTLSDIKKYINEFFNKDNIDYSSLINSDTFELDCDGLKNCDYICDKISSYYTNSKPKIKKINGEVKIKYEEFVNKLQQRRSNIDNIYNNLSKDYITLSTYLLYYLQRNIFAYYIKMIYDYCKSLKENNDVQTFLSLTIRFSYFIEMMIMLGYDTNNKNQSPIINSTIYDKCILSHKPLTVIENNRVIPVRVNNRVTDNSSIIDIMYNSYEFRYRIYSVVRIGSDGTKSLVLDIRDSTISKNIKLVYDYFKKREDLEINGKITGVSNGKIIGQINGEDQELDIPPLDNEKFDKLIEVFYFHLPTLQTDRKAIFHIKDNNVDIYNYNIVDQYSFKESLSGLDGYYYTKDKTDMFLKYFYTVEFNMFMFEVLFGYPLRFQQVQMIRDIYNELQYNSTYTIRNMIMGGGKTSVITPMVSIIANSLNKPVIIILPQHLVNDTVRNTIKYRLLYKFNTVYVHDLQETETLELDENFNYIFSDTEFKNWYATQIIKGKNYDDIAKLTDKFYIIIDEIDTVINPVSSNFNKILSIGDIYIESKKMILLQMFYMAMNIYHNKGYKYVPVYDELLNKAFGYFKIYAFNVFFGRSTEESHGTTLLMVPYSFGKPIPHSFYSITEYNIMAMIFGHAYLFEHLTDDDIKNIKNFIMKNNYSIEEVRSNGTVQYTLEELGDVNIKEFLDRHIEIYFDYIIHLIKTLLKDSIWVINITSVDIIPIFEKQVGYSGTTYLNLPIYYANTKLEGDHSLLKTNIFNRVDEDEEVISQTYATIYDVQNENRSFAIISDKFIHDNRGVDRGVESDVSSDEGSDAGSDAVAATAGGAGNESDESKNRQPLSLGLSPKLSSIETTMMLSPPQSLQGSGILRTNLHQQRQNQRPQQQRQLLQLQQQRQQQQLRERLWEQWQQQQEQWQQPVPAAVAAAAAASPVASPAASPDQSGPSGPQSSGKLGEDDRLFILDGVLTYLYIIFNINYKPDSKKKHIALIDVGMILKNYTNDDITNRLKIINKDEKYTHKITNFVYFDNTNQARQYIVSDKTRVSGADKIVKSCQDVDDDTLFYYDSLHIIGTDIPNQDKNMVGVITISYINDLSNTLQGAFRLRKLLNDQHIYPILYNERGNEINKKDYRTFLQEKYNIDEITPNYDLNTVSKSCIIITQCDNSKTNNYNNGKIPYITIRNIKKEEINNPLLLLLDYLISTENKSRELKKSSLLNQNLLYYYKCTNKKNYILTQQQLFAHITTPNTDIISYKLYDNKKLYDDVSFYYTPYNVNNIKVALSIDNENITYTHETDIAKLLLKSHKLESFKQDLGPDTSTNTEKEKEKEKEKNKNIDQNTQNLQIQLSNRDNYFNYYDYPTVPYSFYPNHYMNTILLKNKNNNGKYIYTELFRYLYAKSCGNQIIKNYTPYIPPNKNCIPYQAMETGTFVTDKMYYSAVLNHYTQSNQLYMVTLYNQRHNNDTIEKLINSYYRFINQTFNSYIPSPLIVLTNMPNNDNITENDIKERYNKQIINRRLYPPSVVDGVLSYEIKQLQKCDLNKEPPMQH